ncbi:MAG: FecR domain-containing protein [Opitutaceae bacterium]
MSDPSDSLRRKRAPHEERSVLDWAREEGQAGRVMADLDRYLKRRSQRRQRAAFAVVTVLLIGGWAWRPWVVRVTPAETAAVLAAAHDAVVLRPSQQTLPDGSLVELNAGAEIEVDFSGPLRRVILRRGEGHFQVAKNPQRAFVVSAGEIDVRAVGTAFAVDHATQRVEVLVTEGRVSIDQPAHPSDSVPTPPLGTLDAGNQMIVTRPSARPGAELHSEITTVSPQAMATRLAWRVPRLEFAATPLSRAVLLFNEESSRRGGDRLVLGDPALGNVLLSGVLRADDVESLLRLLAGEFHIRSEREGNAIVLRRD